MTNSRTAPTIPPRPLPTAGVARSRCDGCGAPIVWAVTMSSPNGHGGKAMPLDPSEDLAGNVAVTAPHHGRLLARVLTRDESINRPGEYAAMTHFATCPVRAHPTIPAQLGTQPRPHRPRGRRR